VYGYIDINGIYHGDYKARITGVGLLNVYETYPSRSKIPVNGIQYIENGQSDVPVYHEFDISSSEDEDENSDDDD
jgi:hypothetical protein